jgi:hypothetical protein
LQKAGGHMIRFEDRSDGGMTIIDNQTQIDLSSEEAQALWEWLSDRNDTSSEKQLEIHLYQEDLSHLDDLKAAIPGLHERGPIVKVFDARWDSVTKRALQLLKAYQIEYHVHPLLEDDDTYAQA